MFATGFKRSWVFSKTPINPNIPSTTLPLRCLATQTVRRTTKRHSHPNTLLPLKTEFWVRALRHPVCVSLDHILFANSGTQHNCRPANCWRSRIRSIWTWTFRRLYPIRARILSRKFRTAFTHTRTLEAMGSRLCFKPRKHVENRIIDILRYALSYLSRTLASFLRSFLSCHSDNLTFNREIVSSIQMYTCTF